MIATPEALEEIVGRARAQNAVALDTEFVWERTYFPNLGVVQIGWSEQDVHLLDTVALTDLTPVGLLLADPNVVKILHDAVQDLTILRRATGAAPVNVFDTQRASGFVGLGATISLQDLASEVTGVSLQKGETRTNWCQRPLSSDQIAYAEDDVRYMPAIFAQLQERARQSSREGWVIEEMLLLDDPTLYEEPDPYVQFERVRARGANGLSGAQRSVLRELAAWRETEAREANRTRRNVLPDEGLVEIARRLPDRPQQLPKKGLGERERRQYGEELLAAVRRGLAVPKDERPRQQGRNPDEDRISAVVQIVQAAIAGRCTKTGIDPRIVSTKAEIRDLVVAFADGDTSRLPVLSGWRSELVGNDVAALLNGKATVGLGGANEWPDLLLS